jgi:hypothetical protein
MGGHETGTVPVRQLGLVQGVPEETAGTLIETVVWTGPLAVKRKVTLSPCDPATSADGFATTFNGGGAAACEAGVDSAATSVHADTTIMLRLRSLDERVDPECIAGLLGHRGVRPSGCHLYNVRLSSSPP